MKRPLNKRNRQLARNVMKRAMDELFRQKVNHWLPFYKGSMKLARRSASADVVTLAKVHASLWFR